MALVRCTECGKEVSDRAAACPHCGCPNLLRKAPEKTPTSGQKKPSGTLWENIRDKHAGSGCLILIAVIGLVVWGASSFGTDSGESRRKVANCSSDNYNCAVRAPTGGRSVVLAVTKESLNEMMSSGNNRAIAVMVLNGSAFLVPQNTSVSIVDQGFGVRKVLVLEPGPTLGRTGWINADWVVNRQ